MNELEKMIETWDNGGCIASLEMGGLGPGYEQAIQIVAVEITRAALTFEVSDGGPDDMRRFKELANKVVHEIDEQLGGITGSQFNVALWLAAQWVFKGGPEALIKRVREQRQENRLIQCSKHWPKAPDRSKA